MTTSTAVACQNHPDQKSSFTCAGCEAPLCSMCIYGDPARPVCSSCRRSQESASRSRGGDIISLLMCVVSLPVILPGLILFAAKGQRWENVSGLEWVVAGIVGFYVINPALYHVIPDGEELAPFGIVQGVVGMLYYVRERYRAGTRFNSSIAPPG